MLPMAILLSEAPKSINQSNQPTQTKNQIKIKIKSAHLNSVKACDDEAKETQTILMWRFGADFCTKIRIPCLPAPNVCPGKSCS